MRAIAPNADLRPFQRSARSASSAATRTVRASCSVPTRRTTSTWAATPAGSPSSSTRRTAAASRGYPAPTKSSTARVISASIISSAAGTMPAAMMPLTGGAAASVDVEAGGSVRAAGGAGRGGAAMGGAAEIEVEDAGLDPRVLVLGVHLEDPGEMGGDDHERVADRGRAARQTRAAAAGHERPAVAGGDPDGGSHVGSAGREAHGGGPTPVDPGGAPGERELARRRARLAPA